MIDPLAYCRWNDQHERDNQVAAPGAHCQHTGNHHQGQEQRFNQITARQVLDEWREHKQETENLPRGDLIEALLLTLVMEQRFNQITARQVLDEWREHKQETERHQELDGGVTRGAESMRGFMLRLHLVSTVSFVGAHLHCGPRGSRSSRTYSLIVLFR